MDDGSDALAAAGWLVRHSVERDGEVLRGALDGHRNGGGCGAWRAIMTELVSRSAAVVQRYGGTVDQFTGERVVAFRRPMRGEGLRCANLFF